MQKTCIINIHQNHLILKTETIYSMVKAVRAPLNTIPKRSSVGLKYISKRGFK